MLIIQSQRLFATVTYLCYLGFAPSISVSASGDLRLLPYAGQLPALLYEFPYELPVILKLKGDINAVI